MEAVYEVSVVYLPFYRNPLQENKKKDGDE
jgi:hypothetical protein